MRSLCQMHRHLERDLVFERQASEQNFFSFRPGVCSTGAPQHWRTGLSSAFTVRRLQCDFTVPTGMSDHNIASGGPEKNREIPTLDLTDESIYAQ